MKTIIKNIMLSGCCMLTLVMSTGCDNFLDVRPKAEKLERDLFSTPQGFEDAIYGVYGEMQSDALYGMNLTWGINELLAQHLYCGSTAGEALGKPMRPLAMPITFWTSSKNITRNLFRFIITTKPKCSE